MRKTWAIHILVDDSLSSSRSRSGSRSVNRAYDTSDFASWRQGDFEIFLRIAYSDVCLRIQ